MVTEQTVVTNVLGRMQQAYCGLHGHDNLLQFGQDWMFLKCTSCGHESPGWELSETPAPQPETATVQRPALVRPQFARVRRVA